MTKDKDKGALNFVCQGLYRTTQPVFILSVSTISVFVDVSIEVMYLIMWSQFSDT